MSEDEFLTQLDALQAYLYRASLALLGNEADANDALQDAALRAYVARDQLRGGSEGFKPWMKSILLHVCSDMLKQRQRVVPFGLPEQLQGSTEETSATNGQHEVWDYVADLPKELREVVAMRYVFDLSQEQVASSLAIPVGTVKSRLNRSLRLLRAKLTSGKDGGNCETFGD